MSKEKLGNRARRSKSKSNLADFIQSGSRITRAKNKKITDTIQSSDSGEADLYSFLEPKQKSKQKETSNSTISVETLMQHYEEEFLRNPKYSYITMNIRDYPDKLTLMKLYQIVTENGGFKDVTANCKWGFISEEMVNTKVDYFSMYKRYLFHYEKLFNEATKLRLNYDPDCVTIEDLDPEYLKPVNVINIKETSELTPELVQHILEQDVVVIRNFEKLTNFKKELFDPKYFIKQHPDDLIDIVTQDPEVKTFHRARNDKQTVTLKEYVKYQKLPDHKDETGCIKFGVNIDIGEWKEQVDELVAKIPDEFLFCSPDDSLQYVRKHILGMSQPQMYIKVKGSWTGGHEENLRYRAINLNHGPSSSEWNCVGASASSKLRETVRETYNIDIYKAEGLWYADVDFCLANKIPVTCFNQREGDLVIIGPGCEHWVRGFGKAVQSAWNFGTFDVWQLKESIKRMHVNQKINYKSIVPNWTLLLDIVNHEIDRLDHEYLRIVYKELKRKLEEDKKEMDDFARRMFGKKFDRYKLFKSEPLDSNINSCEECGIDCFSHWIMESKSSGAMFLCVKCADKDYKLIVDNYQNYSFFYKYDDCELDQFFKRIENRLKDPSYIDLGVQSGLLLKVDTWPEVRTKEMLKEEKISYVKYPKDRSKKKGYYAPSASSEDANSVEQNSQPDTRPETHLVKEKKRSKKAVQKLIDEEVKEDEAAAWSGNCTISLESSDKAAASGIQTRVDEPYRKKRNDVKTYKSTRKTIKKPTYEEIDSKSED